MSKQFVRVREADKRALDLHLMLTAIGKRLPSVGVVLRPSNMRPILLSDQDADDPDYRDWKELSIDGFLRLDIDQAIANGGSFKALVNSRKAQLKPAISNDETARAVNQFFAETDDE